MDTQTYPTPVDETTVVSDQVVIRIKIDSKFPAPPVKEFREPLLKRPLDVLISLTMLLMSVPLSLLVAIAIKLEDGGPVFYRQWRWGRFGKKFMVLKFRTMIPDSDKKFGLRQARRMINALPAWDAFFAGAAWTNCRKLSTYCAAK